VATEIERVNAAIDEAWNQLPMGAADARPVAANDTVAELPRLQRAVALAALAAVERTPVLVLDTGDGFPGSDEERAFAAAVRSLVHQGTTVLLLGADPLEGREWPGHRIALTASDAPRVADLSLA
jgi:hypothetical protein